MGGGGRGAGVCVVVVVVCVGGGARPAERWWARAAQPPPPPPPPHTHNQNERKEAHVSPIRPVTGVASGWSILTARLIQEPRVEFANVTATRMRPV